MAAAFAARLLRTHLQQLRRLIDQRGVGGLDALYREGVADLTTELARLPWSERATPVSQRVMLDQLERGLDALGTEQQTLLTNVGQVAAVLGRRQALTEYQTLHTHFRGTEPIPKVSEAAIARGYTAHTASLLRRYRLISRTWSDQAIAHMEQRLSVGMLVGKPIGEMVHEIVRANGLMELERWRAERIVRTEGAYAHGAAKFDAIRALADVQPNLQKRLIETFDDRTGDDSFLLHGQTVPVDEPFVWRHKVKGGAWVDDEYWFPPNRPNDRAVVIPWDPAWEENEAERPLTYNELEAARPTFWRPEIGVEIPPGHVPGYPYGDDP